MQYIFSIKDNYDSHKRATSKTTYNILDIYKKKMYYFGWDILKWDIFVEYELA